MCPGATLIRPGMGRESVKMPVVGVMWRSENTCKGCDVTLNGEEVL